jgi:anti-anti-sigma factor
VVTLEQNEESVIRLEGEVTIATAPELKSLLTEALGSAKELRIDLERANEMDITALQLLCAAEREARGSGRVIALEGRLPDEISICLSEAGLEALPLFAKPM